MLSLLYTILASLCLCACSEPNGETFRTVEILGRGHPETLIQKEFVYRMQFPKGWILQLPDEKASLIDTREPLFTLEKENITITFHNFPVKALNERIPPSMQISRWRKQFDQLDEHSMELVPFSTAGFTGLQFYAEGIQKNHPMAVLAWSMQLTPELFQRLPDDAVQEKADWTLKAVGDPEQMMLNKHEILGIASSIELIREISLR